METLSRAAEGFLSLFEAGGEEFVGMVTGILPTLIIVITFVNAIVRIIGEDRVHKWAQKSSRNPLARYVFLPFIGVFFLGNPMGVTFGKFLDERYKPGYIDAYESFVHPVTGVFPHANPSELFVYLGIAEGIRTLGLPLGQLAIRYFIVGLIVMFIRANITEYITKRMLLKRG